MTRAVRAAFRAADGRRCTHVIRENTRRPISTTRRYDAERERTRKSEREQTADERERASRRGL